MAASPHQGPEIRPRPLGRAAGSPGGAGHRRRYPPRAPAPRWRCRRGCARRATGPAIAPGIRPVPAARAPRRHSARESRRDRHRARCGAGSVRPGGRACASALKFVAMPGHGGPREIQGEARASVTTLTTWGSNRVSASCDRVGQGRHADAALAGQTRGHLIDQRGRHAGLVALEVDDDGVVGPAAPRDDLGDAVGAAAVVGAGHAPLGAEGAAGGDDALVVRGDHDLRRRRSPARAPPHAGSWACRRSAAAACRAVGRPMRAGITTLKAGGAPPGDPSPGAQPRPAPGLGRPRRVQALGTSSSAGSCRASSSSMTGISSRMG